MSNPDKNLFTRTEPEFTVADSEPADQTLDTSDMTRTADAAKKKKANMVKIGAIVAAVVVIFVGLELVLGGSEAPPPPKLTKVAPPPPPAPVPEKAPEAPTPVEQAPAVPAPDAAVPAPAPMADPVPGSISLPPNPAQAGVAPTPVDAPKDLASLNIPNQAKDAPAPAAIQPALVPVAPAEPVKAVKEAPSVASDNASFVKQGEFNLLADRVTALENEMASLRQLDERVKKLEEAAGQSPAAVKPAVEKKAEKSGAAWVDGKPAKKAVKPAAKTTEPKVKNVVKRSDDDATHKKAKASTGGVANQFQLVAIVQGRAWLKTGDGSTVTVQEGDVLPNGAKIVRVDARRDEVQTSEGTLR